MPAQWLGTLEQRPSPLTQALMGLQPVAADVARWLAERPEREREMLRVFTEFLSGLDEHSREQFLAQVPPERLQRLVQMAQRHGIGGFTTTPEGRITFLPSRETLQAEEEWKSQQAANILEPFYAATPEDQERWVQQHQEQLARVRELRPEWTTTDDQGLIRPVAAADVVLRWARGQAEIREIEARTHLLGAQAEETLSRVGLNRAQTQAILDGIAQGWRELGIKENQLQLEWAKHQAQIEQFMRDFNQRVYEFERQYGLEAQRIQVDRDRIFVQYAIALAEIDQRAEQFRQQLEWDKQKWQDEKEQFAQTLALERYKAESQRWYWEQMTGLSGRELDLKLLEITERNAIERMRFTDESARAWEELGIQRDIARAQIAESEANVRTTDSLIRLRTAEEFLRYAQAAGERARAEALVAEVNKLRQETAARLWETVFAGLDTIAPEATGTGHRMLGGKPLDTKQLLDIAERLGQAVFGDDYPVYEVEVTDKSGKKRTVEVGVMTRIAMDLGLVTLKADGTVESKPVSREEERGFLDKLRQALSNMNRPEQPPPGQWPQGYKPRLDLGRIIAGGVSALVQALSNMNRPEQPPPRGQGLLQIGAPVTPEGLGYTPPPELQIPMRWLADVRKRLEFIKGIAKNIKVTPELAQAGVLPEDLLPLDPSNVVDAYVINRLRYFRRQYPTMTLEQLIEAAMW